MNHLKQYFDNFLTEKDFVLESYKLLKPHGFGSDNTIASVCICRDEICQSFKDFVNSMWGLAFDMSSLAGMFTAGITGLSAAIHHAPQGFDKQYYVFYILPHIAIGPNGELGVCQRRGISKSSACGALVHVHTELSSKKLNLILHEDDLEINMLKRRLFQALPYSQTPDLLTLTKAVKDMTLIDLERAISIVIKPQNTAYAIISGIQIHAHDGHNYVSPCESYVVTDGIRRRIDFVAKNS